MQGRDLGRNPHYCLNYCQVLAGAAMLLSQLVGLRL